MQSELAAAQTTKAPPNGQAAAKLPSTDAQQGESEIKKTIETQTKELAEKNKLLQQVKEYKHKYLLPTYESLILF